MNQIQRLQLDLAKRFEDIKATLDEPAEPTGPWFLDIQRAEGADRGRMAIGPRIRRIDS